MKAVITVVGKDKVGIIAMASATCAEFGVNILEISQSVLREYFTMMMVVDIDGLRDSFAAFAEALRVKGKESALEIRVMHEDIFNTMHRI